MSRFLKPHGTSTFGQRLDFKHEIKSLISTLTSTVKRRSVMQGLVLSALVALILGRPWKTWEGVYGVLFMSSWDVVHSGLNDFNGDRA